MRRYARSRTGYQNTLVRMANNFQSIVLRVIVIGGQHLSAPPGEQRGEGSLGRIGGQVLLRKRACYRGCNSPSLSMVFNASTSDRPRWRQNQVPVCRCHWISKRSRLIQSKRVNGASNSSPRVSG